MCVCLFRKAMAAPVERAAPELLAATLLVRY
jgi:hypothetical protein